MANYEIKYKTGDEIFVAGTVQKAEVINGNVYYKIAETEELIPQDIISPKRINAQINIAKGDFSELEKLEIRIGHLAELCEKARSIMANLAETEISVIINPEILQ